MEEIKIKKSSKTVDYYKSTCPLCKKSFGGFHKTQLAYNMKVHMISCEIKNQK